MTATHAPIAPASENLAAAQVSAMVVTQQKRTHKFLLLSVGVAIAVGLLALLLAYRQGVFERHLVYTFATPSGQNLSKGMSVLYKGFKVGYLDALELEPDGRITGQVVIKQKHAGFVTQGAQLRLSKDKIVTTELLLEPGPKGAIPLPSGAELALNTDGGMDALERRILDRVDPVLAELTALVKRLGDPQHGVPSAVEALRVSLLQANTALIQVNTTLKTANQSFADIDKRIKDPRIDDILGNANNTLAGLKANTDELGKTLVGSQQLMATGQQFMAGGQQVLGTTDATMKNINTELAQTLKATQRVLAETVGLMEDMRGSTLGRWVVGPRKAASAAAGVP